MKKYGCILCVLFLLFLLTACEKTEASLYDRGLETVALMAEAIRSEAYLDLLSAAEPLREIIDDAAAGDYSTPKEVYSLSFREDALQAFSGIPELTAVPQTLAEVVSHRLISTIIPQVNAAGGAETLAASTICTIGKTFVSEELKEDMIYIYTFGSGCPVAVTFTGGEDHTVSASACVILNEDFSCGDAGEIQNFFGADTMEVTCISGS